MRVCTRGRRICRAPLRPYQSRNEAVCFSWPRMSSPRRRGRLEPDDSGVDCLESEVGCKRLGHCRQKEKQTESPFHSCPKRHRRGAQSSELGKNKRTVRTDG